MTVRPATATDDRAIAHIHVDSWRVAYRGQMPDAVLDSLSVERREAFWQNRLMTRPQGVFVAEEEKLVIGFCDLVPSRDEGCDPKQIAELAAIYIAPKYFHKGAGRALCKRAFEEAISWGYDTVTLWVLKTNVAAMCFYEAMGFKPDGATKVDRRWNDFELNEVRYRIALRPHLTAANR